MPIKKKQRAKRICRTCGKEFEILKSRLKWGGTYCSQECQRNRPNNKIERKCVICGKSYSFWPHQLKSKAPTCSIECTRNYSRGRHNKKVICPVCKKEFWTSKKNPLQHCSMACRNVSYTGQKKGGFYHTCPTCEQEFYVEKARVLRGEGIFCSRKCRDTAPKKSIEERIKEGGLVELECAWCGKKFVRSRCYKDLQRYCSHGCGMKSRNETYIETKVREVLEKQDIHFKQEWTVKRPGKRPYFADFYLPPNVIIECDGAFWHSPERFPKTCKKDAKKRKDLKELGYIVYVLSEDDINRNAGGLVKRIASENKLQKTPNPGNVIKPRKRTLIRKLCKNCGQEFETIPAREKTHQFCSQNCRSAFYDIKLKCQNCEKTFTIKRYAAKKRFCTIECQKAFTREKNRRECLNCGKHFSPNPADVKRGKAKFCSRKCAVNHLKMR